MFQNESKEKWVFLLIPLFGLAFTNACSSGFESTTTENFASLASESPNLPTEEYPLPNSDPNSQPTSTTVNESSRPTGGSGGAKGNVTGSCGTRKYALHVPSGYSSAEPIALVVAMYGPGDDYQNFNAVSASVGWHSTADKNKFIYMVPASSNPDRQSFLYFNSDNSANWSAIRAEILSLLDCVYDGVGAKYNIETKQIYWIGFSEGATFTNVAASVLSKELKAVAVYGGTAPRLNDFVRRLIPLYFLSGTADFSYNTHVQQAGEWASHPHVYKWVNTSHSFGSLNDLVPPETVWSWMSTVKAEPVESSY